ncbi:MAG TPA: cytochrome c oxidase subunit 3, partial [Kofleriaceae bacterium]|nr:cytochrome c oxidase subunit 3 [Kofleriaceae bacterium]
QIDLLNGKPNGGCFEQSKFDLDPREDGLQAECHVFEVQHAANGSEKARKEITNRCPEEGIGEAEKTKPQFPCWKPAIQPAVCAPIVNAGKPPSPQFGVLVEYGDDLERGDHFVIEAACEPAKPVAEPADIFAEKTDTEHLGQKSIKPIHHLTTHEEQHLESLGPPPEHTNMFLTIYFAMTGLHGIHVLFGVFVFIWLLIRAVKGQFNDSYFGPIDFAALYWHIVDLIWIFLFPLLYLIH